MGSIYIISNDINDKVYIGQTRVGIEERWKKHIDNSKNNPSKQVITNAMNKYGIEHFKIEKIADVPEDDLDYFEMYYIKKYDSFQNGYNMTLGGNNNSKGLSENQIGSIITLAQTTKTSYVEIGRRVGVSDKTVKKILERYGLTILKRKVPKGNVKNLIPYFGKHNDNLVKPCPVRIIELNKDFNSLIECAEYLIKEKYAKTDNKFYVMKSISRALSNKDYNRQTYLKFHLEKL